MTVYFNSKLLPSQIGSGHDKEVIWHEINQRMHSFGKIAWASSVEVPSLINTISTC